MVTQRRTPWTNLGGNAIYSAGAPGGIVSLAAKDHRVLALRGFLLTQLSLLDANFQVLAMENVLLIVFLFSIISRCLWV